MAAKLSEEEVIGRAIRRQRERAGLSAAEVERRAMLGRGNLSRLERGESHPRWGTLRRIAAALAIPLVRLLQEVERIERGE